MNFSKYLAFYLNNMFRFLGIVFTIQLFFSLTFNYQLTKFNFIVSLVCGLLYASSKRSEFLGKGE